MEWQCRSGIIEGWQREANGFGETPNSKSLESSGFRMLLKGFELNRAPSSSTVANSFSSEFECNLRMGECDLNGVEFVWV